MNRPSKVRPESTIWRSFFRFHSYILCRKYPGVTPYAFQSTAVRCAWDENPHSSAISESCGSYMGIINEILTLISAAVGIFRYKKTSDKTPACEHKN